MNPRERGHIPISLLCMRLESLSAWSSLVSKRLLNRVSSVRDRFLAPENPPHSVSHANCDKCDLDDIQLCFARLKRGDAHLNSDIHDVAQFDHIHVPSHGLEEVHENEQRLD